MFHAAVHSMPACVFMCESVYLVRYMHCRMYGEKKTVCVEMKKKKNLEKVKSIASYDRVL